MILRNKINNKPIIEIDKFLSEKECEELVSKRVSLFKKAISHYPSYYRNNNRLEEMNNELADYLFKKLKSYNLEELSGAQSLNNKFRFCQYESEQEFTKHQDGIYFPSENEESKLTFLLYLNSSCDFEGGETQFFLSKANDQVVYEIKPQKGKLVIFDHTIWHNGNQVKTGCKYVLRSDLIFKKTSFTEHNGYIWNLARVDQNTFLSGGRDSHIKMWNTKLDLLESYNYHTKSIIKILPLVDKTFISCSRDMTLKKWNLKGEILKSVNLDAMILSMDTFKGKLFTGDSLGRIEVYDLNLEKKASFEVHQGWIWQTKYYGGSLFSVSDTGSIIKTSIEGQSTTLFEYKEGLFSMEVSNELIYCGSESGTLIRYSIKTNERKEFNYHTDIIRSVKVIDKSILTASEDCTVCLNGQIIVQHENFVQDTIVFDSEIVSAGFSGELKKSNLYLKA